MKRLFAILCILALMGLAIPTGLSAKVSIHVLDINKTAVGNAHVTVCLSDGTPVIDDYTNLQGTLVTYLNDSCEYLVTAEKYSLYGGWSGVPLRNHEIVIFLT